MADKIMEVSVAAVSAPPIIDFSEFNQLREQVSRLADLVTSLAR